MSISPDVSLINQAKAILCALRDPTCEAHQSAVNVINTETTRPEFISAMIHIFVQSKIDGVDTPADIRQLAGLIIKNYVFNKLHALSPDVHRFIIQQILVAVADIVQEIRHTAANLIGKLAASVPLPFWIEMIPVLLQNLESNGCEVGGSMQAIKHICEDAIDKLCSEPGAPQLHRIFPVVLNLFNHADGLIRLKAIETLNTILILLPGDIMSSLMATNASSFIQGLAKLSSDPLPSIRKAVCHGIVILTSMDLALLSDTFQSIVEFMLVASADVNELVAIESCDFWSALLDSDAGQSALVNVLPRLLPLLISRMVLTEEQITLERSDEEAEASGEKEISMKPIHHRAAGRASGNKDEDGGADEEATAQWTLRKQCASVLDNIAQCLNAERILAIVLPIIHGKLVSANEWERESGFLALGALANGCCDEMSVHLPQLYPYFLQSMKDPTPELRCIACWVLGRYCSWCVEGTNEADQSSDGTASPTKDERKQLWIKLLEGLLVAMVDIKPKVQSSSSSAICTLFSVAAEAGENEDNLLVPYIPQVIQVLVLCSQNYGIKNQLLLCDVIGVLADSTGTLLKQPEYCAPLISLVMKKFNSLDDVNMFLFPVMECISSLLAATAMVGFQEYAYDLITRCIRVAKNALDGNQLADELEASYQSQLAAAAADGSDASAIVDPTLSLPDVPAKDFLICALDVLSSMADAFGGSFQTLMMSPFAVGVSSTSGVVADVLIPMMLSCLKDAVPSVRESACALAGDCCKSCPNVMVSIAPQLVPALVLLMTDPQCSSVCTNAIWTIGELAVVAGGPVMSPYMEHILPCLVSLLNIDAHGLYHVPGTSNKYHLPSPVTIAMQQNLAITLGRLAVTNTSHVQDCLPHSFVPWARCLMLIDPSLEQEHAYGGLCTALQSTGYVVPPVTDAFYVFVSAVARLADSGAETSLMTTLEQCFVNVISVQSEQWNALMASRAEKRLVAQLQGMFPRAR